jgi:hypothetical protein
MRIENFPKLKRCDHSPKRDEFFYVSLDPPYFSLDSPFNMDCFRLFEKLMFKGGALKPPQPPQILLKGKMSSRYRR